MISAIINKFGKKTVVIVSSISVGIIVVAVLIILLSTGVSKTEGTFNYQAVAQEYGVSENAAYLIGRTQQYNENADIKILANMPITEIADNLRNEYVSVFKYKKIAQEYGVSQDIAYIADRIAMIDSNADIELLVNLPIAELVDTLREKLLQPQMQVAEEDSQGAEIAYADEAEEVDTEDTNEEPVEEVDTEDANDEIAVDVDTENEDIDTPDNGTNSGEPKQTEWSEWSEWMSDKELGSILSNIGGDKEYQTESYTEYRAPVGDAVLKHRYMKVYIEDLGWIENASGKTKDQIMSEYPLGDFEESYFDWDESEDPNVPLRYYVRRTKYLSDYGEWLPGQAWSDGYDKTQYICEETVDKAATQWGPWGSEKTSRWFDIRTLARYRWKDR